MNRYFVFLLALLPLTVFSQQPQQPLQTTPAPSATATPPVAAAPSSQPGTVKLTTEDFGPFLDGLMNAELTWHNIAGGVVTVVKDGQILLCKGFGYADFARRQTVVPERTLFRPGSITKLFTGIAVMQLVEAGKIDLDRAINYYLDFKIPGTFIQPITMRNLLTHTAGFDQRLRNLFVTRREDLRPLSQLTLTMA